MDLLNIENLTIKYKGSPVNAVENFSLTLARGESVSIVGESGSGKTSVIRAIMGLLPTGGEIVSGDIIYLGKSLKNLSSKEWRALRGREISMIFQDSGAMLNPIRTIGSQFVEYIRSHGEGSAKDAVKRAEEMLEKMHLPDVRDLLGKYPFQLSGGMRQRVGIAMAMTFRPKLLIADEATSALDVTIQAQIVRMFMELKREYDTALISVTHNIGVAAYTGDMIMVMKNGKLTDSGSRYEIIKCRASAYAEKLKECVPDMEGKRYV